jgi:hypothetical protein
VGSYRLSANLTLKRKYTGCPTRYQTRHFFNNSNTNEDTATKFEQEYVHCVRNEEECVCSVCFVAISLLVLELLKKFRVR